MNFTASLTFSFGYSRTGLSDLRAQPRTASTTTGGAITTGFVEIGKGVYTWSGTVPDDTVFVHAYSNGTPAILDTVAVNDVKKIGGITQTGRDIGASVLLSVGTGGGQVLLQSGILSADMVLVDGSSGLLEYFDALLQEYGTTGAVSANLIKIAGEDVSATGETIFGGTMSTFAGGAVASVTGDVGGNVLGSVNSVTTGVTVTTNTVTAIWSYRGRSLDDQRIILVPAVQKGHRELVRGDAYGPGLRAFDIIQKTGAEWPEDLNDYDWVCVLTKAEANEQDGTPSLEAPVTVEDVSEGVQVAHVALTSEESAAMAPGDYTYQVVGTNDDEQKWTLELGTISWV